MFRSPTSIQGLACVTRGSLGIACPASGRSAGASMYDPVQRASCQRAVKGLTAIRFLMLAYLESDDAQCGQPVQLLT
jgi:hypothetical protein